MKRPDTNDRERAVRWYFVNALVCSTLVWTAVILAIIYTLARNCK